MAEMEERKLELIAAFARGVDEYRNQRLEGPPKIYDLYPYTLSSLPTDPGFWSCLDPDVSLASLPIDHTSAYATYNSSSDWTQP